MRRNSKQLKGYNTVKYLLRVKDDGTFEDTPRKFRCKQVGEFVKETNQPQRGMIISNEGLQIETRFNLNFKINDMILDNLETFDNGYSEDGIKYKNRNRINKVSIRSDSDYSSNGLRFKNNHNKIYTLDIG